MGAGDESEVSVAEVVEEVDGFMSAAAVIEADVGAQRADTARIEKDAGDVVGFEGSGHGGVDARGHDGDAGGAVLDHGAEGFLGAVGFVVGEGEEDVEAEFVGGGIEGFDEAGEEGVFDVGNDEAEEVAVAAGEAAGVSVAVEVEFAHRREHALANFGRDVLGVVDDVGDGGFRDAAAGGDVFHFGQRWIP